MKNKEIVMDVIGEIDERLVPELSRPRPHARSIKLSAIGIAVAAVIALAFVLPIFSSGKPVAPVKTDETLLQAETQPQPSVIQDSGEAKLLAAAVYPKASPYPKDGDYESYEAWDSERVSKFRQAQNYRESFCDFFKNSTPVFLNGSEKENIVFSPLSLYFALGMSAEVTDGNTRRQILHALSQDSIGDLRMETQDLWESCYEDDGMAKCVFANSLWMNGNVRYHQSTLDTLSASYYASSFSGDPSDEDYSLSLQNWLNEQTDGLLTEYASDIRMDPQMVLTLASTVNYSGKWRSPFIGDKTAPAAFHAPTGDITCDFMNAEHMNSYCWGERFAAISLSLENNGEMRLILPDEGVDPLALLQDEEALSLMTCGRFDEYENCKYASVTMKIPKFDVSSDIELRAGFEKLGITELFDGNAADFTPLCDNAGGVYVDKAEQDTRVMIDEEGCKAVSMTVMLTAGAAPPKDFVDFILDRPFLFEIVSQSNIPLFVGIVNHPA